MQKIIKLNSFLLEQYDPLIDDHLAFFKELWNDDNSKKYLYNRDEFINNIMKHENIFDSIYLAIINNQIIGFVSLYSCYNTYEVCDGILPKFRGKGYSNLLIKEWTDYIFKTTSLTKLYAYIDESNIASIKGAIKNGFILNKNKEYIKQKN